MRFRKKSRKKARKRPLKVGYLVTLLVAACSLGGTGLALYISNGYHKLHQSIEQMSETTLMLKDLEYIRTDVPHWVSACDEAVETNDTSLARTIIIRAQYLRRWTAFLRHAAVTNGSEEMFYRISYDINRLADLVQDHVINMKALPLAYDSVSFALVDNVYQLSAQLNKQANLKKSSMEERRESFEYKVWLSILFYFGLCVVLWQWTVSVVVGPLHKLSKASLLSLEHGTPLAVAEEGPEEIRYLTRAVSGFVENLEEKVEARTSELHRQKDDLEQTAKELQRLETQAQLMAKFAELSPEPVLRFDKSGSVLMANPAAAVCFRNTADPPTSVPLKQLIPGLDDVDLSRCIDEGLDFMFSEVVGERTYQFVMRGIPTLDAGHLYGFDITAQIRADEKKRELEFQLMQSQKLETIGTLAGGIAHDFNNILTPILGYTGLIRSEIPGDSEISGQLESVLSAANRAKNLVQQILTFSRQSKQKRKPIQMSTVIDDVVKLLRASLPSNISLDVKYRTKSCCVFADESQMHQVIMNLCTNAYQAIKPASGRIQITVDCVELDEGFCRDHTPLIPGHHIVTAIEDSGSGIDHETLEHIFEPFFTTKGMNEGTGLGLSVVHGVILQHDGVIKVETEIGKGTCFRIYLPEREMVKCREETGCSSVDNGCERIMFIDDEKYLGLVAKAMLEKLGYQVSVWADCLHALNVFKNQYDEFDIVIVDQTMPGMTGNEMLREIRRIRPDIPVIVITGYSETVTPVNYRNFGFTDYIMKPLTQEELSSAVRQALDKAASIRINI